MLRKGGATVGRTREDTPMTSGPPVALAPAVDSSEGPTYYAEDQVGFWVTQAGPGSLPVSSGAPQPLNSVPDSLFSLPFDVDVTDGEHVVEGVLPRAQAVGPNFGRGRARSALDHIYLNCKDSRKENRRFDDLVLPVPMRNQTAMERGPRLIPKMSGAAFCRSSRNGRSSKTVTIHSAKSNKL